MKQRSVTRSKWSLMWMVVVAVSLAFSLPAAYGQAKKVDLNTATQKELEDVKGVGPATAKKIIAGRPYKSVDELKKAGLSDKQIKSIGPSVTVGAAPAPAAAPAAKPAPAANRPRTGSCSQTCPCTSSPCSSCSGESGKGCKSGPGEACPGREGEHQHGPEGKARCASRHRTGQGPGDHRRAALRKARGHHESQRHQTGRIQQDQGHHYGPLILPAYFKSASGLLFGEFDGKSHSRGGTFLWRRTWMN